MILARAVQLLDGKPHVDLLLDLSEIAVKGRGRERFAPYEDVRLALEQTALNVAAVRDRDLLQELLELFDAAYQRAKDAESALDFEDLQLRARDLLSRDESVRSSERLRFRSIMVDEFQDTNRLQCEIVDQFDPEELFFVGDEFQSIYRFRHADVEVFRERRAGSEGVLPLRANYRSRPELLDVVNELFAAAFGEGYEPLVAAGRFPDPARGPAVELLVNDKRSYKDRAATGAAGKHAPRPGACGSSATRERRRRGRSCSCSPRVPTPRCSRRSCARSAYRRTGPPAGGTSRSSRCSTCSRTSGFCTTAMTTRRLRPCSPRRSSGCRTTGSCCCGAPPVAGRSSPVSSGSCRRASPHATSSSSARSGSGTNASSRSRPRPGSSG